MEYVQDKQDFKDLVTQDIDEDILIENYEDFLQMTPVEEEITIQQQVTPLPDFEDLDQEPRFEDSPRATIWDNFFGKLDLRRHFSDSYLELIDQNAQTFSRYFKNSGRNFKDHMSVLRELIPDDITNNIVTNNALPLLINFETVRDFPYLNLILTVTAFAFIVTMPFVVQMIIFLITCLLTDNLAIVTLIAAIVRFIAYLLFRKERSLSNTEMVQRHLRQGNYSTVLASIFVIVVAISSGVQSSVQTWAIVSLAMVFLLFKDLSSAEYKSPTTQIATGIILITVSFVIIAAYSSPDNLAAYTVITWKHITAMHKDELAEQLAMNEYLKAKKGLNDEYMAIKNGLLSDSIPPDKHDQGASDSFYWYSDSTWMLVITRYSLLFVFLFFHKLRHVQFIKGSSEDLQRGMMDSKNKGPSLLQGPSHEQQSTSVFLGVLMPDLCILILSFEVAYVSAVYDGSYHSFLVTLALYAAATCAACSAYIRWYQPSWRESGKQLTIGVTQMNQEWYFGCPASSKIANELLDFIKITASVSGLVRMAQITISFNILSVISLIPLLITTFRLLHDYKDGTKQKLFVISLLACQGFYQTAFLLLMINSTISWDYTFEYYSARTRNTNHGQPMSMNV